MNAGYEDDCVDRHAVCLSIRLFVGLRKKKKKAVKKSSNRVACIGLGGVYFVISRLMRGYS